MKSAVVALVFGTQLTRTPDADAFDLEEAMLFIDGGLSSGTMRIERINYSPTSQTSWITNARVAGPLDLEKEGAFFYGDVASIVYDGWINGSTPNMFRLYTTGSSTVNCSTAELGLVFLVHDED